uniref:Uncharacterized protein n=1 Tax=Ciona savignyi TaxID=51511 RepID=H2YRI9_CIOSA
MNKIFLFLLVATFLMVDFVEGDLVHYRLWNKWNHEKMKEMVADEENIQELVEAKLD